jgi:hypothetical protein
MHHFKDGVIDEAERVDLKRLLDQFVSGELSAVSDTDAATTLPLDQPPPLIERIGMTYVFTGQFAFGPRRDCSVLSRSGRTPTYRRRRSLGLHVVKAGRQIRRLS